MSLLIAVAPLTSGALVYMASAHRAKPIRYRLNSSAWVTLVVAVLVLPVTLYA